MRRTILALAAMLALPGGCGQSAPPTIVVKVIEHEAGTDAADGPASNSMGRCCAMALPIVDGQRTGDAADAVISLPTDNCSVLARHTLGVEAVGLRHCAPELAFDVDGETEYGYALAHE